MEKLINHPAPALCQQGAHHFEPIVTFKEKNVAYFFCPHCASNVRVSKDAIDANAKLIQGEQK